MLHFDAETIRLMYWGFGLLAEILYAFFVWGAIEYERGNEKQQEQKATRAESAADGEQSTS